METNWLRIALVGCFALLASLVSVFLGALLASSPTLLSGQLGVLLLFGVPTAVVVWPLLTGLMAGLLLPCAKDLLVVPVSVAVAQIASILPSLLAGDAIQVHAEIVWWALSAAVATGIAYAVSTWRDSRSASNR